MVTTMSDKIRILLVDDHALMRGGVRSMLEAAGLEVAGEAVDGRHAAEMYDKLSPDLVLMDVGMPNANGIEGVRIIRATHSKARILMLSMHADEQYVFESLRAGAGGYVLKDVALPQLLTAIKSVVAGKTYLSPGISEQATQDFIRRARSGSDRTGLDALSLREREVLQLVAAGHSSTEIGKLLFISARTVDTHRQHIMEKLGIRKIAELTRFAIRHGLCAI